MLWQSTSDPGKSLKEHEVAGYMLRQHMRQFEAPALAVASDDLITLGPGPDSANAFAAATNRRPGDLAAWAGLYQADPSRWALDEPRLAAQAKRKDASAVSIFRLAALRYYRAQADFDNPGKRKLLVGSGLLFLRAWRLDHQPMAGFMLWQNLLYTDPGDPSLPGSDELARAEGRVLSRLASLLMGPEAYRVYLRAKQFHLDADPPPAKMTPRENWRMLCCLLRIYIPPAKNWQDYLAPSQPDPNVRVYLSREVPLTHQMVLDRRYYGKWLMELGAKVPVY